MAASYKFNDLIVGYPGGSGSQIGGGTVVTGPQQVDTVLGGAGALQTSQGVTTQLAHRGGPRLGMIALGYDTASGTESIGGSAPFGEAEFMYVAYTGTVSAGDLVVVDRYNKTAARIASDGSSRGLLGIAMAAAINTQFGWVMIRGVCDFANVLTGSTPGNRVYMSAATAGRITTAVNANSTIDGMQLRVSGAANVGTVDMQWPSANGN